MLIVGHRVIKILATASAKVENSFNTGCRFPQTFKITSCMLGHTLPTVSPTTLITSVTAPKTGFKVSTTPFITSAETLITLSINGHTACAVVAISSKTGDNSSKTGVNPLITLAITVATFSIIVPLPPKLFDTLSFILLNCSFKISIAGVTASFKILKEFINPVIIGKLEPSPFAKSLKKFSILGAIVSIKSITPVKACCIFSVKGLNILLAALANLPCIVETSPPKVWLIPSTSPPWFFSMPSIASSNVL